MTKKSGVFFWDTVYTTRKETRSFAQWPSYYVWSGRLNSVHSFGFVSLDTSLRLTGPSPSC